MRVGKTIWAYCDTDDVIHRLAGKGKWTKCVALDIAVRFAESALKAGRDISKPYRRRAKQKVRQ